MPTLLGVRRSFRGMGDQTHARPSAAHTRPVRSFSSHMVSFISPVRLI